METEEREELIPTPKDPLPGGVYRHRKGGNYIVLGVARPENKPNKLFVVAYRKINGTSIGTEDLRYSDDNTWLRPLDEFMDGRFIKIGDKGDKFRD